MKNTITYLQSRSLRLALCTLALGMGTTVSAQTGKPQQAHAKATSTKVLKAGPVRRSAHVSKYKMMRVHGTVVDVASGKPLAGVQLHALGSQFYAAMTDGEGKFAIAVPTFTTSLYVHTSGYMAQQVAILAGDSTQQVGVRMIPDKYREMYTDGTTITAQSSFTANSNSSVIDNDIENTLGADVRTITRSAAPAAGATMFIRGLNSLNANAQPLVVLDGVELDMQQNREMLHTGQFNNVLANLSPDDIDEVKVLKNATALYGARGSNGVIIITTKRGHSMATRIDANIGVGVALVPKLPTMMNATQYREYATEMLGTVEENLKQKTPISFRFLNDDPNNYYYYMYHNNTDWTDYVYHTALTQNYSINVQGGDDIGMYNLSVGYQNDESTAKQNDFERMNVRFNTDINVFDNLKTKFDISISRTTYNVFDDGIPADLTSGAITSPTFLSLIKSPLVSPYQYNSLVGGFTSLLSGYDDLYSQLGSGYSLANPVAILNYAQGDNKNSNVNTFFNVRVEPTWTINRSLSLTSMFAYNLDRNSQRYQRPYNGVPPFDIADIGQVTSKAGSLFSKEINVVSDTHLDWHHQYGRHSLSAFGGFRYTYFSFDDNNLSTQYNGVTNDKNPALSTSGYAYVAGDNDVWKYMKWYGNVDYNYMNRYFATVSLSAEANSRFGDDADGLSAFGVKWALFPSVQLGWVLTNENWFPKSGLVNYLRLNVGYDVSGNDGISNYAARTSLSSVRFNYDMIGLKLTNIGNDKVQWETNKRLNAGLTAYLLDNRLSFDFNWYINKINNLLTLMTFDNPVGGINTYWTNGGRMQNTGLELTVTGKPVVTHNWQVELGASLGHYKNEVKELPNGSYTSSVYGQDNILTEVGRPAGVFYGYRTQGVFSTDAEAKAAGKNGYLYMTDNAGNHENFKAGDVHFVDVTQDGEISEADKQVIGDPNPDIYGNIFGNVSWKGVTLALGFNYCLGNDVYNYQRSVLNSGSDLYNQQVSEVGRWRYEGQTASLPRAYYGDPMGNNRFSDRWIEDGSYLRLKTVKLAWQLPLPESWMSWLQGIQVWAQANNVFTLTKYKGSDPEFSAAGGVLYQGIDNGNLAQGRSFQFGLKINL